MYLFFVLTLIGWSIALKDANNIDVALYCSKERTEESMKVVSKSERLHSAELLSMLAQQVSCENL